MSDKVLSKKRFLILRGGPPLGTISMDHTVVSVENICRKYMMPYFEAEIGFKCNLGPFE
jgi:hypothetical protein